MVDDVIREQQAAKGPAYIPLLDNTVYDLVDTRYNVLTIAVELQNAFAPYEETGWSIVNGYAHPKTINKFHFMDMSQPGIRAHRFQLYSDAVEIVPLWSIPIDVIVINMKRGSQFTRTVVNL